MKSALVAVVVVVSVAVAPGGCVVETDPGQVVLVVAVHKDALPPPAGARLEMIVEVVAPGILGVEVLGTTTTPLADDVRQVQVPDVKNGRDRTTRVAVQTDEGVILWRGESAPFDVEPGLTVEVGVVLLDAEGWRCAAGLCEPVCGDGFVRGPEDCDDGNTGGDDGCGADCQHEPGALCLGEPSSCGDFDVVAIPAGRVTIGVAGPDIAVDAFSIMRTEATQAQLAGCIEAHRCAANDDETNCRYAGDGDDAAIAAGCLSRDDAAAFCSFAGMRLCSEAEWERAARGDTGATHPWGEQPVDCTLASYWDTSVRFDEDDAGCGRGIDCLGEVGAYPAGASPFGVLDMAGNASEWVADCNGSPADSPRDGAPATRCEGLGGDRGLTKGGACLTFAPEEVSAVVRRPTFPGVRDFIQGARCCGEANR